MLLENVSLVQVNLILLQAVLEMVTIITVLVHQILVIVNVNNHQLNYSLKQVVINVFQLVVILLTNIQKTTIV